MLINIRFEGLMFSSSDGGFFGEGFSVLVNIGFKLFEGVGQSASSGEQDVVDHIVVIENISVSIFEFLGKSGNITVVIVGSSVEVVDEVIKFGIEVSNKLLDGFNQLLKVPLGLQVQFSIIQNKTSPI